MQSFDHPALSHQPGLFKEASTRLLFTGDWAPVRHFENILSQQPGRLYHPALAGVFANADYRIVNVEAVLSHQPESLTPVYKEGPNLAGPAAAVADLQRLGTDLALLANNHSYDFGTEGLHSTARILDKAGIPSTGWAKGQADAYHGKVVAFPTTEVAFVNFQEGEEGPFTDRAPEIAGWDLARVTDSIRQHSRQGRTVIAIPHGGREYLPCPAPYIQQTYRQLVEAGAAAVIAHHPHVPRGMEVYRGAPILYSLGNFAFWQDHPGLFRKLGLLAEVALGPSGQIGLRLLPYRITESAIRPLHSSEFAPFQTELAALSGPHLAPDKVKAQWNAAIDAIPLEEWYLDCTGMDYGMQLMKQQDPVGLARLRTRLSSPAHFRFITDGINRILAGRHGQSAPHRLQRHQLWTEATDFSSTSG